MLCVVAHPDDEVAFAATLFKTSTHLDGVCDLLVITNGEAGFRFSTLGERLYAARLTDPVVGRTRLPEIRRRELRAACDVLGVREIEFLGQTDHRNTKDQGEVLASDARVWDLARVRAAIERRLATGRYDFVLTHLPVPDTHGHHKAATILALDAVAAMPARERPVVLGAYPSGRDAERPPPPMQLDGHPFTAIVPGLPPFEFDREQKFGVDDRLDYQIVVNWAIAEHKSQGTFQQLVNRWRHETFYAYAVGPPDARERAARWFARLQEPQFATPAAADDQAR